MIVSLAIECLSTNGPGDGKHIGNQRRPIRGNACSILERKIGLLSYRSRLADQLIPAANPFLKVRVAIAVAVAVLKSSIPDVVLGVPRINLSKNRISLEIPVLRLV